MSDLVGNPEGFSHNEAQMILTSVTWDLRYMMLHTNFQCFPKEDEVYAICVHDSHLGHMSQCSGLFEQSSVP